MIKERHGHSCKAQHVSVYGIVLIYVLYTDFQDPRPSFHWEMIFNMSNTRMSIQVSYENDGPKSTDSRCLWWEMIIAYNLKNFL